MNPKVSIIMNCHNGEEFLEEAIDSVYNQTYQNWEIIFVDNNSNDSTSKIAKSFDNKLIYFKLDNFLSLYEARNIALDLCNGKLISFLDSDDIWVPEKLEKQISILSKEYPIVYGGYQIINSHKKKSKKYGLKPLSGFITDKLLTKNFISIGCVLIDSQLIKSYKFDPYFELLGDYELWIRLSIKNKFNSTETILEYSRTHKSNITKTKSNLMTRERRYFYKKLFKILNYKYFLRVLYLAIKYEIKGLFLYFKKYKI